MHRLTGRTNIAGVVSCHWQTVQRLSDSLPQDIICAISKEPAVHKVFLAHSTIGDVGCSEIMKYLLGRKQNRQGITEIDLRYCKLGDGGLKAVGEVIEQNTTLETLLLQGNSFGLNEDMTRIFVKAVNSSRLKKLGLSSNSNGNNFVPWLLHLVDSSYLREVELSMTGLQPSCVPYIVSFIRSPRCRLRSLTLNGNMLGFEGVKDIVVALRQNYTLTSLDVHANHSFGDPASVETHKSLFAEKETLQTRNQVLQRLVSEEAARLLHYARIILLQPEHARDSARPSKSSSSQDLTADKETLAQPDLPKEIILHILSFIAPSLSEAQRIRIYEYASDPTTLPPLLPNLLSYRSSPQIRGSFTPMNRRDEERGEWLRMIRCEAYDCGLYPDPPEVTSS